MSAPNVGRDHLWVRLGNQVFVAPAIQSDPLTGNVTLTWPSVAGRSYQVEYSPDLFNWFSSPTGFLTSAAPTSNWTDSGPPATDTNPALAPQRFYRVFQFGWP